MTGKCLLNDASETQKGTPRGIWQAERGIWQGWDRRTGTRIGFVGIAVAILCREEYAAGVATVAIAAFIFPYFFVFAVNVAGDAQLSP